VVIQYLTAEIQGRLVEDHQCIRLVRDFDGRSFLLVFPLDFTASLAGHTVHIIQGGVSGSRKEYDLQMGEDVLMGGGGAEYGVDPASFYISARDCLGPYWIFGGMADQ